MLQQKAKPETDAHAFLIEEHQGDVHPIDFLADIREKLKDKPPYAQTLKMNEVGWKHKAKYIHPKVMDFLGTWKVPDRFAGGKNTGKLWANPYCESELRRYGDISVTCDCGLEMGNVHQDSRKDWYGIHDSEDCTLLKSTESYNNLVETRYNWIKRALSYDLHPSLIAARMGVSMYYSKDLTSNKYKLDISKERRKAKVALGRTAEILNEEYGFTFKKIAQAYDVSRHTLQNWRLEMSY